MDESCEHPSLCRACAARRKAREAEQRFAEHPVREWSLLIGRVVLTMTAAAIIMASTEVTQPVVSEVITLVLTAVVTWIAVIGSVRLALAVLGRKK